MRIEIKQPNGNNATVWLPKEKWEKDSEACVTLILWQLMECHGILVSSRATFDPVFE